MNIQLYNPWIVSLGAGLMFGMAIIVLLVRSRAKVTEWLTHLREKVFTRTGFFWVVNIIFMAVSVLQAGNFFGIAGKNTIAHTLGFAVSFFLDLVTIILMQAMLEARHRGEDEQARRFLFFITICCSTSTFANLAISLNDYNAITMLGSAPYWVQAAAPYVLASFPLFVIMMSLAAEMIINIRPMDKLNEETFESDEQKRIKILEIRNRYLTQQIEAEKEMQTLRAKQRVNRALQSGRAHRSFRWFWQKPLSVDLMIESLQETIKDLQGKLESEQKRVSSLSGKLNAEQKQVSILEAQLDTGRELVSNLRGKLGAEQKKAESVQLLLDSGQETVSSLRVQLNNEVSSVQSKMDREVSSLRVQLDSAIAEVDSLRVQLDKEVSTSAIKLDREVSRLTAELDTLHVQLDAKESQLTSLKETLNSGMKWHEESAQQVVSSVQLQLNSEREKVSSLQKELDSRTVELDSERKKVSSVQLTLSSAQLQMDREVSRLTDELDSRIAELDTLRVQLDNEVSTVQSKMDREVSSLRVQLDREKKEVSSLQQQLDSAMAELDTLRVQQDSHKSEVDTKVIQLGTNRTRKSERDDNALGEQIRSLLKAEPGLSGRAIAARIGCSPTTAAKWKSMIETEYANAEAGF